LYDFELVDSVVYAETDTEVESTSAISNEVRSLSQNLQKELVWPEKSFGEDLWDLVAIHNPDDAWEIAVWRCFSYEIGATCVRPQMFFQIWCGISES